MQVYHRGKDGIPNPREGEVMRVRFTCVRQETREALVPLNPPYSAVPFVGTESALMSTPSSLRSAVLRSMPPAYPVKLRLAPTTR